MVHKVALEQPTVAGLLEEVMLMQEQLQAISVLTKACRSAAYYGTSSDPVVDMMI
jgi:hypothetical protein